MLEIIRLAYKVFLHKFSKLRYAFVPPSFSKHNYNKLHEVIMAADNYNSKLEEVRVVIYILGGSTTKDYLLWGLFDMGLAVCALFAILI